MAEKKNKALKFFRETKSEMKKVSWPSKEHLFRNTAVILAFVISDYLMVTKNTKLVDIKD